MVNPSNIHSFMVKQLHCDYFLWCLQGELRHSCCVQGEKVDQEREDGRDLQCESWVTQQSAQSLRALKLSWTEVAGSCLAYCSMTALRWTLSITIYIQTQSILSRCIGVSSFSTSVTCVRVTSRNSHLLLHIYVMYQMFPTLSRE